MKKTVLLALFLFIQGMSASLSYAIQGDLDASGFVDGSDLALFSPKFGSTAASEEAADITKDSALDGSDLAIMASNFGQADGVGKLAAKVVWGSSGTSKIASGSRTLMKAPASVATVRITVTGADFADRSADFAAALGRGTLSGIPAGSNRVVTITGLDAFGIPLYEGSATVSVMSGQETIVDIFAASVTVTSTNIDPPGLLTAQSVSGGVYLNWSSVSAATGGYNVYYGSAPNSYSTYTSIPSGLNQFTLPLATPGNQYLYLTSLDSSGRESWFSNEAIAPGLPTVTISAPADGSFTNQTTLQLLYTFSGATSIVTLDDAPVSKVSGDWLNSLSDGLHRVSVKATDLAFNSYSTSVSFVVDTIAPEGSVTIEQGDYTNDPNITVTITATDADGVAGYYLHENVATPAPPPFSGWTTFSAMPVFAMSNVGYTFLFPTATNISCWFIDRAGNISLQSNDTVIQDYVAPGDVSAVSAASQVRRVELSWTNPVDADFDGVRIMRDPISSPTSINEGTFVADVYSSSYADDDGGAGLTVGAKYYYALFAFDKAGNYAPGFTNISAYPFQTTPMVAAGAYHSIALHSDGSVYAWGDDAFGQLGDDLWYVDKTVSNTPVSLQHLGYEGVMKVAAGDGFTVALKSDGIVYGWGANDFGQLGGAIPFYNTTALPVEVPSLSGVKDIAVGDFHTIAIKNDGTVWTTGANTSGQLGNGDNSHGDRNVFAQISGFDAAVVSVSAGILHSLALDENGDVWAWGDNSKGQFGVSTTLYPLSDKPFKVFTGIIKIAAGGDHSLALKNDGSLYAWGYNSQGQLGNNEGPFPTAFNSDSPVLISVFGGLGSVSIIGAGRNHTVVADSYEDVWTWGLNNHKELGSSNILVTDNDTPNRLADYETAPTGVISVDGGEWHTIVLDASGNIWTWGSNSDGQIGEFPSGNEKPYPFKITDLTLQ